MNCPSAVTADLDTLVRLFWANRSPLGQFTEQTAEQLPEPYRSLLAHEHHMTVTVEKHYGGPVDVLVLDKRVTPTHYAREILLALRQDQEVVQFGLMRVRLDVLSPEVRREIEQEETPLGRILIQHDVLRTIHLVSLWHVLPGPELRQLFGLKAPRPTYGRTAIIRYDGEPAVELLEILTPI